jgi:hypothetical protein
MVVMSGFQVHLCGRTVFTAGSLLCTERQPDITGLPLERSCTGCSVEGFERQRSEI